MRLRLCIAELGLPAVLRRREIRRLAEGAAHAFGAPAPRLRGLSAEDAWCAFIRFTQGEASRIASSTTARRGAEVELRREAEAMGRDLRRRLGVRSREDVLRSARLIYRAMGIDFRSDPDGAIRIPACSCSDVYSPETCRIVSALDEGLLRGLAGGGTLSFSARLTEGAPACLARFDFPEALR